MHFFMKSADKRALTSPIVAIKAFTSLIQLKKASPLSLQPLERAETAH